MYVIKAKSNFNQFYDCFVSKVIIDINKLSYELNYLYGLKFKSKEHAQSIADMINNLKENQNLYIHNDKTFEVVFIDN